MESSNRRCYILLLELMMSSCVLTAHLDICQNEQFGPSDDVNSYNGAPPGGTDQAYLYDTSYNIDCCGVLEEFRASMRTAGDVYFQIWKPVAGFPGTYEIVKQFVESCPTGVCPKTLAGADKITVFNTYKWGWYAPGSTLIAIKNNGGVTVLHRTINPAPAEGEQYSWSGATPYSGDQFGIELQVKKNNVPDFTTLTDGSTVTDSILETAAVGDNVFTVQYTDQDVDDVAGLQVSMTTTSSYFDFDNVTGIVSVKAGLGPATSPEVLTFEVVDQCHNVETATLSITIINEPPVIYDLPASQTIPEITSTRFSLKNITVLDSNDPLTCYILNIVPNPTTTSFSLEQQNVNTSVWELFTTNGATFDADVAPNHVITIECDDGQDQVTAQFTINLSPNIPPVINGAPNATSFHEDVITEFKIFPFTVTDADTPDDIQCSFGGGTTPGTGTSKFRIRRIGSTTDWGIYTLAGVRYDYASEPQFNLEVSCTDGYDTTNADFTVYIEANQRPVITNLPINVNLSRKASTGDSVFIVTATDVENDHLFYNISCDPSPCDVEIFDSGHIELLIPAANIPLVGFTVNVTVSDHRGYGTVKVLSVLMTNINDIPTIDNLGNTISIPENSALDLLLETVQCSDNDVPVDTLTYSMTCVPATGSTIFTVNSNGEIKTSPTTQINYEPLAAGSGVSFVCTVTCSDGEDSDSATISISVIDVNEAPAFGQNGYSVQIDEGVAGTALQAAAYSVYDPDTGDSKTFTIDCGANTGYFVVNSATGVMSYASNFDADAANRPLFIPCNMTVTDSGGLTDTVSVDVTINDVNDNIPVFSPSSYAFFGKVNARISTTLDTVTVTDIDVSSFGDVTLSLDQTNVPCDCFGVTNDGKIFVKGDLSQIGVGNSVNFEVVATDGGGQEVRAPVTMVVIDTPVPEEVDSCQVCKHRPIRRKPLEYKPRPEQPERPFPQKSPKTFDFWTDDAVF